jgi:hypothetical protein
MIRHLIRVKSEDKKKHKARNIFSKNLSDEEGQLLEDHMLLEVLYQDFLSLSKYFFKVEKSWPL